MRVYPFLFNLAACVLRFATKGAMPALRSPWLCGWVNLNGAPGFVINCGVKPGRVKTFLWRLATYRPCVRIVVSSVLVTSKLSKGADGERSDVLLSRTEGSRPQENASIVESAKEEGTSESALCKWRQEAHQMGRLLPASRRAPEGWTSKKKFAAVIKTIAMNKAQVAEYGRKRGLYPEHHQSWREACKQATDL